jgi:hypothetical protein
MKNSLKQHVGAGLARGDAGLASLSSGLATEVPARARAFARHGQRLRDLAKRSPNTWTQVGHSGRRFGMCAQPASKCPTWPFFIDLGG